eukprot:3563720-Pyramimonas_sp.AAC.1
MILGPRKFTVAGVSPKMHQPHTQPTNRQDDDAEEPSVLHTQGAHHRVVLHHWCGWDLLAS